MTRSPVSVVTALVLVAVGCGGSDDTTGQSAGTTIPAPTLGAAATSTLAPLPTTTAATTATTAVVVTAAPPATTTVMPATTVALTTTTVDPNAPPVMLVAPPGWATSTDGLTIAESADDLTGTSLSGYRVLDVTDRELETFVDESDIVSSELDGEPDVITVAGYQAMSVALIEQTVSAGEQINVTIVVDTGDGSFQVFVFQGPHDTYPDNEPTLFATLQPRR